MIQILTDENRETLTNVERNLQEAINNLGNEQIGSLRTNVFNAYNQLAEITLKADKGDYREVRLSRKLEAAQALIREMLADDKPQEKSDD